MTQRLDDAPAPDFLRDPPAAEVYSPLISVDDHVVEPPHAFVGRVPQRCADAAPRVVELKAGQPVARDGTNLGTMVPERDTQAWRFDDRLFLQVGLNAVAGHSDYSRARSEPARFEEMRPGCYDINARVHDMDLGGIWASVNFPSQVTGFCGTVFSTAKDPELGIAVTRAWNDWLYEEWHAPYPDRIVPMGITFLADPEAGAREIRRNAERGFTAVTLPELPHRSGFPALVEDHWTPILEACADTDTAITMHVGSSGMLEERTDPGRYERNVVTFPVLSLLTCIEWLFSGVPTRYPSIKLVLAEGGIGWVPMLMDRVEYAEPHAGLPNWADRRSPTQVLHDNFYFCTLDDPTTLPLIHRIGIDNVMMEVDYPHSDSTWPYTQELMRTRFEAADYLSPDDVHRITCGNAARIFRHPLPDAAT